jgi:hypothetical protein
MSITSTLIMHPAKQTKTLLLKNLIHQNTEPCMHHYHDVFHVRCTIFLCHVAK